MDLQTKMRITGVEPARLAAPEPKSGASANSAISAYNWIFYFFYNKRSSMVKFSEFLIFFTFIRFNHF